MKNIILYILLALTTSYVGAQEPSKATDDYISFYQKFLSTQKNSNCAMYPSCSAFGRMVFKEKPFYEAITLIADRMMRCSHDAQYYEIVSPHGYRSLVDYPYYHKTSRINYPSPSTDVLKPLKSRNNIRLFINFLINTKNYQSALLEIERILFFDPYASDSLYAQKLLCYRAMQNVEKGIFEYETEFPKNIKQSSYVNMQAAILYYIINNHIATSSLLDSIVQERGKSEIINKAYALKGIIEADSNKFIQAKQYLIKASTMQSEVILAKNLDIIKQMEHQKKKNPLLAQFLSIIPGAGYLYTDHKGSALTALIINSLLGYATYTSIKQKNYGVAGLCSFLSLSFYIGNINGAGRSATRYNRQKHSLSIKQLEILNNIFIN